MGDRRFVVKAKRNLKIAGIIIVYLSIIFTFYWVYFRDYSLRQNELETQIKEKKPARR